MISAALVQRWYTRRRREELPLLVFRPFEDQCASLGVTLTWSTPQRTAANSPGQRPKVPEKKSSVHCFLKGLVPQSTVYWESKVQGPRGFV